MTIRIDVHPVGETPNNMSCMLPTPVHACPVYAFCGQSPYVTTFHWLPQSQNRPLHPEELLTTKDRLAQPSSRVASFFLPCDSPGVGERDFGPMVTQLLKLTGPISPACDRYVQYLLAGANPSVLNRYRWGLQPWRCRLATYHSLTFPTSCLHFPLMARPVSSLTKFHQLNQSVECKEPMAATWSSNHPAIYHSLHLYLATANNLSLVIG
jgi:hypothetical protein